MIRSLGTLALGFGMLVLTARIGTAQIGVGGHFGYDVDLEEIYLGANGMITLPVTLGDQHARLNPEFSYYLTSSDDTDVVDTSVWLAAVSFIYPFGLQIADFYGGVGLELTHVSTSIDIDPFGKSSVSASTSDSSTKFGGNIKIGAAFSLLFGEIGYHLRSDIGGPYAQGGLRLSLGG